MNNSNENPQPKNPEPERDVAYMQDPAIRREAKEKGFLMPYPWFGEASLLHKQAWLQYQRGEITQEEFDEFIKANPNRPQ